MTKIKIITQRYMLPTIFKTLCCIIMLLIAIRIRAGFERSISMDVLFDKTDIGLTVEAYGNSMIADTYLKEKDTIQIPRLPKPMNLYLFWSGEVSPDATGYHVITVTATSSYTVTAKTVYKEKTRGIVYACVADITNYYAENGIYEISGLKSEPLGSEEKKSWYAVGGYALVFIYQDPSVTAEQRVIMMTKLHVLMPGEFHSIRVLEQGMDTTLTQVTIIGGHGLKGNAGATMINRVCFSQKEDWDGSQGRYWDVDTTPISYDSSHIKENGLVVTFDPLLQWIYPISCIFVFK